MSTTRTKTETELRRRIWQLDRQWEKSEWDGPVAARISKRIGNLSAALRGVPRRVAGAGPMVIALRGSAFQPPKY